MATKQISLFRDGETKLEIKKHSSMVQLSNITTLQERKTMNALLRLAKNFLKRDPATKLFTCDIGIIKRLAGLRQTDNEELKKALRALWNTSIEYNVLNKDSKVWGFFRFLSEVKIVGEESGKATTITFEFPNTVLETIKNPNMFVKLDLLVIRGLESKHSVAIYELLKDYINLWKLRITIEDFRRLMGITEGQYNNFTMFKKRVIDLPVNEINSKTDMTIGYEFEKLGRVTTAVIFRMSAKAESKPAENIQSSIEEKLKYYWIKKDRAADLLKKHDEQYLLANIAIVEEQVAKWEIQNVTAYLLKAFQTDFRTSENEYTVEQKKVAAAKEEEKLKQQAEQDKLEQLKTEYHSNRKQAVADFLKTVGDSELEAMQLKFKEDNINSSIFQKAYMQGWMNHILIQAQRQAYITKLYLPLQYQSAENYIAFVTGNTTW